MGLDVYIYRYENFEETQRREKKYEKESEKIWDQYGKDYKQIKDADKEAARKACIAVATELGLTEDGEDKQFLKKKIEISSKVHPKHMFKIGYFRSSYNAGGLDHVLETRGLPSLYDIFGVTRDDYKVQPDWNASRLRAIKARDGLKAEAESPTGNYFIHSEAANPFIDAKELPKDEKTVLETFKRITKEHGGRKRDKFHGDGWSNRDGSFYLDKGLDVRGMIPGVDILGRPCVYMVCKHRGKKSQLDWYIQALDVVIEACEWVAKQPDKEKLYMHWSG